MKQHRNIPIFIPHLGCPNQCVFCNQRLISEEQEFSLSSVSNHIEAALRTIPHSCEVEIAFFGGSFTGIDRDLMISLLEIAERYVRRGEVNSIRLSTRPDYIDEERLGILSEYSVKNIELGLQSMNDEVLLASGRGHTAKQSEDACRRVVDAGFALTGQMMIGLPQATVEDELETARRICELGAVAARIYPTVVFAETPLCHMAKDGEYRPLTNEEAAVRAAQVLRVFRKQNVRCIRIGLCSTETLVSSDAVYAGPNHPALGELVLNEYYYGELLLAASRENFACGRAELWVPRGSVSKVVGQHRRNLLRLERERGISVVRIREDADLEDKVVLIPWQ